MTSPPSTPSPRPSGFLIVESLVGVAILGLLATAIIGLAGLGVRSAIDSERRTVALNLANQQLEQIRALGYQQANLSPQGTLPAEQVVQQNSQPYTVKLSITPVNDPLTPAVDDYKKVLANVSWVTPGGTVRDVELATYLTLQGALPSPSPPCYANCPVGQECNPNGGANGLCCDPVTGLCATPSPPPPTPSPTPTVTPTTSPSPSVSPTTSPSPSTTPSSSPSTSPKPSTPSTPSPSFNPSPTPQDTDNDGIPDFQDPDDDNDGIPDNNDPDDDNDGIPDDQDPDTPPPPLCTTFCGDGVCGYDCYSGSWEDPSWCNIATGGDCEEPTGGQSPNATFIGTPTSTDNVYCDTDGDGQMNCGYPTCTGGGCMNAAPDSDCSPFGNDQWFSTTRPTCCYDFDNGTMDYNNNNQIDPAESDNNDDTNGDLNNCDPQEDLNGDGDCTDRAETDPCRQGFGTCTTLSGTSGLCEERYNQPTGCTYYQCADDTGQ